MGAGIANRAEKFTMTEKMEICVLMLMTKRSLCIPTALLMEVETVALLEREKLD